MTDISGIQATEGVATYRPLSSLMLFSRLLRERFAGTLTPSTSSPARLERT